jgi:hypothetical protein
LISGFTPWFALASPEILKASGFFLRGCMANC